MAGASPFYSTKPLSENTFNSALARMGDKYLATVYGSRALFATVVNETCWRADVIERLLAHKERNQVWADYLDASSVGQTLAMP